MLEYAKIEIELIIAELEMDNANRLKVDMSSSEFISVLEIQIKQHKAFKKVLDNVVLYYSLRYGE